MIWRKPIFFNAHIYHCQIEIALDPAAASMLCRRSFEPLCLVPWTYSVFLAGPKGICLTCLPSIRHRYIYNIISTKMLMMVWWFLKCTVTDSCFCKWQCWVCECLYASFWPYQIKGKWHERVISHPLLSRIKMVKKVLLVPICFLLVLPTLCCINIIIYITISIIII